MEVSEQAGSAVPVPVDRLGLSLDLLVVQALVWVLSALVLDGGVLCQAVTISLAGYWAGVGMVAIRRGLRATRWDRAFVRWGGCRWWSPGCRGRTGTGGPLVPSDRVGSRRRTNRCT